MTTTGGSIGASLGGNPKITNVGFNQDSRDKQGITRNTVVGNVEITKAEGSPINRDLGKANEITKDTHRSTNINVEPQVIEYLTNPGKLKEDIWKAKEEINDIKWAIKESIHDRGDDNRNFFGQLREMRLNETIDNIAGERLDRANTQKDIKDTLEAAYKDLGYDVDIRFSTPSETPKLDGKGGTAYVGDDGKHTVIINSGYLNGKTKGEILGVISEEVSHVINGAEGRQIATGTDEKVLESTGRATNEYFKDKYKDDDTTISLTSEGAIDTSKLGTNVGDKGILYLAPDKNGKRVVDEGIQDIFKMIIGRKKEMVITISNLNSRNKLELKDELSSKENLTSQDKEVLKILNMTDFQIENYLREIEMDSNGRYIVLTEEQKKEFTKNMSLGTVDTYKYVKDSKTGNIVLDYEKKGNLDETVPKAIKLQTLLMREIIDGDYPVYFQTGNDDFTEKYPDFGESSVDIKNEKGNKEEYTILYLSKPTYNYLSKNGEVKQTNERNIIHGKTHSGETAIKKNNINHLENKYFQDDNYIEKNGFVYFRNNVETIIDEKGEKNYYLRGINSDEANTIYMENSLKNDDKDRILYHPYDEKETVILKNERELYEFFKK